MHLFLIGYRATGKTSVATELGKQLILPVIDLDDAVVHAAGKSIAEIFEHDGESSFRELETKQLKHICVLEPAVVSLGGGAILAESNREWISQYGKTVWLKASPHVIRARMLEDQKTPANRPSLTGQNSADEIDSVMRKREPIYAACADYTIETDELSPNQVAEQIAKWWNEDDTNNIQL